MSYERLIEKISDRTISQSIIAEFSDIFSALISQSSMNRLTERKLSQKFGAQLLNIIQKCSSVLKNTLSGEKADILLSLMKKSLVCLFKIHHEAFAESAYSYILRLIESKRYAVAAQEAETLLEELKSSESAKDKMTELNTIVARSNAILQSDCISVSELETVYELVAKRARKVISSASFPRDLHSNLNKVYFASFKLLFKVGKLLDNISGPNVTLRKQALSIKITALEYFERKRPFHSGDFFAFAYSAISTAFKIAHASASKELYEECLWAYSKIFPLAENHSWKIDKNTRNMIELQAFINSKLSLYKDAKQVLQSLVQKKELGIVHCLYNVKYCLEIARYSYMDNPLSVIDFEKCIENLELLFDKQLSSSVKVSCEEVEEVKEISSKIDDLLENWLRIAANTNSASSIKEGIKTPFTTLKLMTQLARYHASIVKFEQKLGISKDFQHDLYHYVMFFNNVLLYSLSKEKSYEESSLAYLSVLLKEKTKYLNNLYIVCIGLTHVGEKELAIKYLYCFLQQIQFNHMSICKSTLALLKLLCKLYTESNILNLNIKKMIRTLIMHRAQSIDFVLEIVELYTRLHLMDPKSDDIRIDIIGYHSGLPISLKARILEQEFMSYSKVLIYNTSKDIPYIVEIIQTIIELLGEIYSISSYEYSRIIVKYIELLSIRESCFANERILSKLFGKHYLNALPDQLGIPQTFLWRAISKLNEIKENEETRQSQWSSFESMALYKEVVHDLHEYLQRQSTDLQMKNSSFFVLEKTECIRNLMLAADITQILCLNDLEVKYIELLISLLSTEYENHVLNIQCLKSRLAVCYWEMGDHHSSINVSQTFTSPPIDDLLTELWRIYYQTHLDYLKGNLQNTLQNCQVILSKLADSKHEKILKSYTLLLISKIHLLNSEKDKSLEYCELACSVSENCRLKIQIHNLSLNNSIYEHSLSRYNCAKAMVFPHSSWSVQNICALLFQQIGQIYTYSSAVHQAQSVYIKGETMGRILGLLSLSLKFKISIVNLERSSLPNNRIFHDNIRQESSKALFAVNFIENIQRQMLEPFVNAEYAICPKNLENLSLYFNRNTLYECMVALGDILQTPVYYERIENPVELNYYRLAKSVLFPKYGGHLKQAGLLYLKEANMLSKSNKEIDCSILVQKSINALGCCETFYMSFIYNNLCCKDFAINPHSIEDLSLRLLILSDIFMKQSKNEMAYTILKRISEFPQINHPSTVRQINYLLSKIQTLSQDQRAFYNARSIGVSYKPKLTYEAFSLIQRNTPENWTLVLMSVGRGSLSEGISMSRMSRAVASVSVGGNCECCRSESLSRILGAFSNIMKNSAKTLKQVDGWWKRRERLNEQLSDWLGALHNSFFRVFSCLFLGQFTDSVMDFAVRQAAQIFGSFQCPFCNQEFSEEFMYSLLNAALTGEVKVSDITDFFECMRFPSSGEFFSCLQSLQAEFSDYRREPVILILDGNLLHLPWESFSPLKAQEVTRLPNFSMILPRLKQTKLNFSNLFYILNPSDDLERTQRIFEDYFRSYSEWTGIVQEAPSSESFAKALEHNDFMVYCGHSAGEQYIKGEIIGNLRIKACSMLMGCSSGLLRNCGQFESQGIAIQYLMGDCPCVIANLWDVTDRDIDRLTLKLLKEIYRSRDLASSLSKAREACKLKFLIGAAPVVYGVPIHIK